MNDLDLREARRLLLRWYRRARRDLPWRRTRDPYRIWISEIMLQQTRVDAVIPHYERFLRRFPSVHALASASLDEVLQSWAGLGYYSRARNLHGAARQLLHEYGGALPADAALLRRLPGIGAYTAGAIASVAFGLPEPVVDGNVERLFARLLAWEEDLHRAASRRYFWNLASRWARARRPGDVNQALMELGATLCTPVSPECPRCPLRRLCRAHGRGTPTAFPRARRRAASQTTYLAALLIHCGASLLLVRRRSGRLLRDWWEVPMLRTNGSSKDTAALRRAFRQRLGFDPGILRHRTGRGALRHGILAHQIHIQIFETRLQRRRQPRKSREASTRAPGPTPLANLELQRLEWRWTRHAERQAIPLSTAARKILSTLDSGGTEEKGQGRGHQKAAEGRRHPPQQDVA